MKLSSRFFRLRHVTSTHKCKSELEKVAKFIEKEKEQLSNNEIDFINSEEIKRMDHKCGICKEAFLTNVKLQKHKVDVHEEEITCLICKAEFTTKQSRDKHVAAVHEKKKPYLCPHCGLRQGRLQIWTVWYYGLSSFQVGVQK